MAMSEQESYLAMRNNKITAYVGPDATKLFAAIALRAALEFWVDVGMRVSRAHTPTNMRYSASRITGKTYKVGKAGCAAAIADLDIWIETMRSALPIRTE